MSGWRETAKSPRFIVFDARLAFFWFLFLCHMRTWTFLCAALATLFFWASEYMGYSLNMMMRNIRARIAGPTRPCRPWWRGGVMALPVAALLSTMTTGFWPAPAQAGFEILPAQDSSAGVNCPAGYAASSARARRLAKSFEIRQTEGCKIVKRVLVGSFGRNIPLHMVTHALIPASWKVALSPGIRSRPVSWLGQKSWRGALQTIAHNENLLLVIDGAHRRVVMQSNVAPESDKVFCRSIRALIPDGWTLRSAFTSSTLKASPWAFNTCR